VGSIVCVAMLEPLPRPLVATGRDGTPLTVWTAHMVRAGIVVPRRSRTTPYDGLAIRDRSPWPQGREEPDEPDGFVAVWLDHPYCDWAGEWTRSWMATIESVRVLREAARHE
jgi:hypothetical protein